MISAAVADETFGNDEIPRDYGHQARKKILYVLILIVDVSQPYNISPMTYFIEYLSYSENAFRIE